MSHAAFFDDRGDRRAELLPTELLPLFDDRFVISCGLFEEYIQRLAVGVVRSAGIDAAGREPGTPREIAARAGLDPARAEVPVRWLLETLAKRSLAVRSSGGLYSVPGPLPETDAMEIVAEQERHDPSALASYRLAEMAAELYPGVLRGTTSGEEALFAPERIGAWFDYFSNDNIPYAISN
ncbi:MAG: hypothetical protein ACRD1Z_20550, partial [Vicinamibacteria bacterium]